MSRKSPHKAVARELRNDARRLFECANNDRRRMRELRDLASQLRVSETLHRQAARRSLATARTYDALARDEWEQTIVYAGWRNAQHSKVYECHISFNADQQSDLNQSLIDFLQQQPSAQMKWKVRNSVAEIIIGSTDETITALAKLMLQP